ncbi:MAG: NifB/NifX family molybdenum-iron cluster-binding protein [Verrucomicrobiae bacterium]|nr:NifB/NifX family molybdenum-iron cluster-binding protein [Verrucomicrobiae bacterium]MCP5521258.1 NifB/NifX family molybdenum-iron cluster-binding protein [Verrucomicrobiales bacterium]
MKIAIPTEDGHLHGHFGGCRQFTLIDVDPGSRKTLRTETVPAPEHQPGLFPRWLRAQGVDLVIVGGVGHRALANFVHHGVSVRAGLPGGSIEAQVAAFLEGRLTQSPEDCGHHHHHHHHHDHHHHHGHPDGIEDAARPPSAGPGME